MYSIAQYSGADMPAKTLCLTYDDGPGEYSYEIAAFLASHHIKATFFVVGKYAAHRQDVLQKMKELGHVIGNHTYDHPDLPYYVSINGDVHDQVSRTDITIKPFTNNGVIYFRPPYGKWSREVANQLNHHHPDQSAYHVGPIYWEVAGYDCYYWDNGFTVQQTADKYLLEIANANHRGIIVMHDDISDMDLVKPKNKTLELTKMLIPILLEQGYKFIGLDELESIKKVTEKLLNHHVKIPERLAPAIKQVTDQQTFYLHNLSGEPVDIIYNSNPGETKTAGKVPNTVIIYNQGYGKVAIKASNGLFLSFDMASGHVLPNSDRITTFQLFDMIPVTGDKFILRVANGNYVTFKNKLLSTSNSPYMRQAEAFYFLAEGVKVPKPSLQQSFLLQKKRLLFIRSKVMQLIKKKDQ